MEHSELKYRSEETAFSLLKVQKTCGFSVFFNFFHFYVRIQTSKSELNHQKKSQPQSQRVKHYWLSLILINWAANFYGLRRHHLTSFNDSYNVPRKV